MMDDDADINQLSETRRALHQIPEVGLDLPATQRYLLDRLAGAGIECYLGATLSSVIAVVRGTHKKRLHEVVLVRSDMDALPVAEQTGLPFAATGDVMHACGHDLHMAAVLHAILRVQARRSELRGDAVFVFQPGEEGHGGAERMLSEGVLDILEHRPVALLGMHVLAHHLANGAIVSRPGAVFAGSILLDISVTGRGGHGSAPHLARSALTAAAELVTSVAAAFSSRISAFQNAVLSFGELHAGSARNIIPDRAELGGVIRYFDEPTAEQVEQLLRRHAAGIALAHEVEIEIVSRRDTVPTVTDSAELELLREIVPDTVTELDQPLAISEDFSWFLREVPGVFLLVGAATGDPAVSPSNHSASAIFDESVLVPMTRLIVDWVFGRLEVGSGEDCVA